MSKPPKDKPYRATGGLSAKCPACRKSVRFTKAEVATGGGKCLCCGVRFELAEGRVETLPGQELNYRRRLTKYYSVVLGAGKPKRHEGMESDV